MATGKILLFGGYTILSEPGMGYALPITNASIQADCTSSCDVFPRKLLAIIGHARAVRLEVQRSDRHLSDFHLDLTSWEQNTSVPKDVSFVAATVYIFIVYICSRDSVTLSANLPAHPPFPQLRLNILSQMDIETIFPETYMDGAKPLAKLGIGTSSMAVTATISALCVFFQVDLTWECRLCLAHAAALLVQKHASGYDLATALLHKPLIFVQNAGYLDKICKASLGASICEPEFSNEVAELLHSSGIPHISLQDVRYMRGLHVYLCKPMTLSNKSQSTVTSLNKLFSLEFRAHPAFCELCSATHDVIGAFVAMLDSGLAQHGAQSAFRDKISNYIASQARFSDAFGLNIYPCEYRDVIGKLNNHEDVLCAVACGAGGYDSFAVVARTDIRHVLLGEFSLITSVIHVE